jgi:hypothetical protein
MAARIAFMHHIAREMIIDMRRDALAMRTHVFIALRVHRDRARRAYIRIRATAHRQWSVAIVWRVARASIAKKLLCKIATGRHIGLHGYRFRGFFKFRAGFAFKHAGV